MLTIWGTSLSTSATSLSTRSWRTLLVIGRPIGEYGQLSLCSLHGGGTSNSMPRKGRERSLMPLTKSLAFPKEKPWWRGLQLIWVKVKVFVCIQRCSAHQSHKITWSEWLVFFTRWGTAVLYSIFFSKTHANWEWVSHWLLGELVSKFTSEIV